MTCFRPLTGWYGNEFTKNGKRRIVFDRKMALPALAHNDVSIPCGKCVGCRLNYSKGWAQRCLHEAQLHDDNCFITLTYSDENLPDNRSLRRRDVQLFLKRLRKKRGSFRYYGCGEYGPSTLRPHYHLCLFGLDFNDRVKMKYDAKTKLWLYASDQLTDTWGLGHTSVGDVSFQSAAYVARYIMKKQYGARSAYNYCTYDAETGEVIAEREKEFPMMSTRGGIGKAFYERYKGDMYPKGFLHVNGVRMQPAKYYDRLFELEDPVGYKELKRERASNARKKMHDNSPERLKVREECLEIRLEKLKEEL